MTVPKLILFVPCERVVVDSITNRLTLSFVFDSIQPIPFNPEGNVPSGIPAADVELFKQSKFFLPPLPTITVWSKGDVEDNADFEQMLTITAPDNRETDYSQIMRFRFNEGIIHRIILGTNAMMGRLHGLSILTLKIRRFGEEEWHNATTYPLYVEEIPKAPETPMLPLQ